MEDGHPGVVSHVIVVWSCQVDLVLVYVFFFQAEDGIRDLVRSRGLGDVYKRQVKVTYPEDFALAEAVLRSRET